MWRIIHYKNDFCGYRLQNCIARMLADRNPFWDVYLSKEVCKETKIIPSCVFRSDYWKPRQCCRHFIELFEGWNEIMYKVIILAFSSVVLRTINCLPQHLPLKGQGDSLWKEMRSTLEIAMLSSGQMNLFGMRARNVCCKSDWDQDLMINPEIGFIWEIHIRHKEANFK